MEWTESAWICIDDGSGGTIIFDILRIAEYKTLRQPDMAAFCHSYSVKNTKQAYFLLLIRLYMLYSLYKKGGIL